jgi:nucleotide-binding universal stress UspA family protein
MDDTSTIGPNQALQDFRSARQKANMSEIMARLKGVSNELLSFEDVRQKLRAQVGSKKVLKDIPISSIVGSVNRYQDFSRDFLPGQNVDEDRWANIEVANYGFAGLPPIDAYQIDEVYFVSDGNHRVSVARQLGADQIQAYVTEVPTRVALTADIRPEDLILKSEYADFLEDTNLDQLRPGSDLTVTEPGQYEDIEEHISVHRYFMGIEQLREIPYPEAVTDWYDVVYMPVVEIIRDRGLLFDFPNRTEADLYLWILDHRAALEDRVSSLVEVSSAADDLADQYSKRTYRVIARLGNKIVKTLVPGILTTGPNPGEWRQTVVSARQSGRLFNEILVPVNGLDDGWCALEQAMVIARREGARIHGLTLVASTDGQEEDATQAIKADFSHRCEANGINHDFQVKTGEVAENISERARWNDLVVLNLSYPPDTSLFGKVSSGIRSLVQRCPRPILFTPQVTKPLQKALLAYDGSLKAQEALFIAAYLGGKWGIPLNVVTIGEEGFITDIQGDASKYLEQYNVQAQYIMSVGENPAQIILQTIERLNVDLLLSGGYGRNPILEVVQGGAVDEILRQAKIPILLCR